MGEAIEVVPLDPRRSASPGAALPVEQFPHLSQVVSCPGLLDQIRPRRYRLLRSSSRLPRARRGRCGRRRARRVPVPRLAPAPRFFCVASPSANVARIACQLVLTTAVTSSSAKAVATASGLRYLRANLRSR